MINRVVDWFCTAVVRRAIRAEKAAEAARASVKCDKVPFTVVGSAAHFWLGSDGLVPMPMSMALLADADPRIPRLHDDG